MKVNSKIILFVVTAIIVVLVSYSYLSPSATLGDFSKFSPNSEINQTINVAISDSKTIEKSPDGKIASFYGKDKNNLELKIELHEPIPEELIETGVVELLGHLHGNIFVASRVTAVK